MEVAWKIPLAKKLFEVVDKNGIKRVSSYIVIGCLACLITIVGVDVEHVYSNGITTDPLKSHLIVYIVFFLFTVGAYATRTMILFYTRLELLRLFKDKPDNLEQLLKVVTAENLDSLSSEDT